MFSIIISEKGGAERRETFDKNEINVGRVQGNDLMLPKGNVSKHHARLLYRDGRFIVTDLKSTNGTYVNGRKIAQATIVREGDKIYIGDFVLRLDGAGVGAGAGAGGGMDAPAAADEESIRTLSRGHQQAAQGAPLPAAGAPIAPTLKAQQGMAPQRHPSGGGTGVIPPAQGMVPNADPSAVSHYPLERDPDESDSAPMDRPAPVAAPAPMAAPKPGPSRPGSGQGPVVAAPGRASSAGLQAPPGRAAPAPVAPPAPVAAPPAAPNAPAAPRPMAAIPAQARGPRDAGTAPQAGNAGRRLALVMLVDRITEQVDPAALRALPVGDDFAAAVERVAREQVKAMSDGGEAPEGVDLDALARDAHRELVGLGPLAALLDDDDVAEIHVARHDQVLVVPAGGGAAVASDVAFTSDEALARIVARLAFQSGDPWKPGETVIERRLARGAHVVAVVPPASAGSVLVVRKRRRVETTLDDLVRGNALSRPMAAFLEHALHARANVFVCGPAAAGGTSLLAALAAAAAPGERVVVLSETDDVGPASPQTIALTFGDAHRHGDDLVRVATQMRADRLVVASRSARVVAATVEAIAEGAEGVLLATRAPSLRQGLARLASQLLLARPGIGIDATRECIGESFDVAIELALVGGTPRVTKIAELAGSDAKGIVSRDVFLHSADGGPDGSFSATGVVPRIAGEISARGAKVDPNLFKRSVGR